MTNVLDSSFTLIILEVLNSPPLGQHSSLNDTCLIFPHFQEIRNSILAAHKHTTQYTIHNYEEHQFHINKRLKTQ